MYCSSIWLTLSVCPSVSGWKAVETLSITPNSFIKLVQNLEVNRLSLSEIIDSGSPWYRQISFRNISANCSIGTSVVSGMKCAILENLSTMTQILVYPADSGNPIMKSIEMDFHGRSGTSIGDSSPNFLCLAVLLRC